MIKVGPRLWKTGLAVAMTVFLLRVTGIKYEVFGAIAAVLAVAPSASHSLRASVELILVNVVGGLIGMTAMAIFGPNPVVIGAVAVAVLALCQSLGWQRLATSAVTVTLFIMAPHPEAVYAYWGWRMASVVVGSVIGTAVNALILRPDYWPATARALQGAGLELDRFVGWVADGLVHPAACTKAEVLSRAAAVERQIAEVRRRAALLGAATGRSGNREVSREVLERSVKVLASLLERIQIVHKAALTAERLPGYAAEVAEMQAALAELVDLRRELYDVLVMQIAAGATLAPHLLAIERRFEGAIRLPEQAADAEPFFRLYRMRSSISYMANRLGRLIVAMDGAADAYAVGAAVESPVEA